jgi:hypothetical protein
MQELLRRKSQWNEDAGVQAKNACTPFYAVLQGRGGTYQ